MYFLNFYIQKISDGERKKKVFFYKHELDSIHYFIQFYLKSKAFYSKPFKYIVAQSAKKSKETERISIISFNSFLTASCGFVAQGQIFDKATVYI